MSDKTFKYGELEATLNLADYRDAERWENALEAEQAAVTAAMDLQRSSAQIKAQVDAIAAFYDAVFGPGSAEKAYGNTADLEVALDANAALVDFVTAQANTRTNKYSKYLPVKPKK